MFNLARGRFALMLLAFVPAAVLAQPAVPQDPAGLPGFRTVETAITTTIKKSATTQIGSPGYLGVLVEPAKNGAVTVAEVADASPAAKAGVQVGDVVRQVDGRAVQSPEVFRSLLQTKSGGEKVILNIVRNGKAQEVTATLTATSRVMQLGQKRAAMGVTVEEP
jgi:S1-C subfamily serine protease